MAEKKQSTGTDAANESPGTGRSSREADGKKSAVAKAADGLAAKLTKTGKAAAAKAADMAGGASRPTKAAGDSAAPATRAAPRKKIPDLKKDLRDFAAGRPQGWGHDDWLQFLESLQSRGHNINDREAIGLALERERLDYALSSIKGLGPQRRQALVERYGTVWALRGADTAEIARAGNLPADLAQRVKTELPGGH